MNRFSCVNVDELIPGDMYRLRSRNLVCGVWSDKTSRYGPVGKFIGVRRKWEDLYLDSEFPNVEGSNFPFQTVFLAEPLGIQVPDGIVIAENLGDICGHCKQKAWWTGPPSPAPWACEGGCEDTAPYAEFNKPLFDFIIEIEKEHGLDC